MKTVTITIDGKAAALLEKLGPLLAENVEAYASQCLRDFFEEMGDDIAGLAAMGHFYTTLEEAQAAVRACLEFDGDDDSDVVYFQAPDGHFIPEASSHFIANRRKEGMKELVTA